MKRCGLLGWAIIESVVLFSPAFFIQTVHAGENLAAKIEQVINGPNYQQASWGILVADAETGEAIYAHNPDRLFLPASTTKIYSCAAALAVLGPDYKFETPVYRRGKVEDGKLQGDLILVAKGDLTLGGRTGADGKMAFKEHDHIYATFQPGAELTDTDPLAGLKSLARQVAQKGIRHVTGDVLVDDRLFPKSRGSGSGPDLLTPIVINDNVVDLLVTPGAKEGDPAKIVVRPESRFFQIDARIVTVGEGKKPSARRLAPGPQRLVVRGEIPLKSQPLLLIHPLEDPTAFARALFIEALEKEGVTVAASPLQPPTASLPDADGYVRLQCVGVYTSPPFSEVVKVTLKVSHNLYASTLPILAAVHKGQRTLSDGLKLQGQFLTSLGIPAETISFGGGAGGAPADAVTPRATVQLLRALAKRSDYPAIRAGLPVLGVDGTLADVVKPDSPARGKAWAKTGTMIWSDLMNGRQLLTSKALAGILKTANGRELVVAMFVNNVPLPKGVTSSREGKVLGKLCEIIYQEVP